MTRIIALANQKGGVGKTTTTLNLGAALAERGHRVLLVDLDPQSNLTVCLGLKPYEQEHTTYQVLLNPKAGLAFAIQPVRKRLDLVPATLEMAAAEIELASRVGRETLLRRALASVRNNYDYILLDPPPSLGLFTLNALGAANEVVIPLQAHPLALKGLGQLQQPIDYLLRDDLPIDVPVWFVEPETPPPEVHWHRFGEKLRSLRRQRKLTQVDAARALGLASHAHVSHLESNRKEPSIDLVLKIAAFFGVTTDYLLRDNIPLEPSALTSEPSPPDA